MATRITSKRYADKIVEVTLHEFPFVPDEETSKLVANALILEYESQQVKLHLQKFLKEVLNQLNELGNEHKLNKLLENYLIKNNYKSGNSELNDTGK